MKVTELQALCNENLSQGFDFVNLVFPKPSGRLCGKHGPRGYLICECQRGYVIRFKASAVLRFLEKECVTNMEGR